MSALTRPWRITLIVSLLLNVLLIAALATGLLREHGYHRFVWRVHDGPPPLLLHSPHALRQALTEPERALLRASMHAHSEDFRAARRELWEVRRELEAALATEPFDRARFEAGFARLRESEARLATIVQGGLVDFAADLDANGRARLAKALRERPPGEHRERRRGERDDAPPPPPPQNDPP